MSKWISIEAAAAKYIISEKVLLSLEKSGGMPVKYQNGKTYIYEPYIDYNLHHKCDGITHELLDTFEEFCISKTVICNQNLETIRRQDEIIKHQRKIIENLKEVQNTMSTQDIRLRDCKHELIIYKNTYSNLNWKIRIYLLFETMIIKIQRLYENLTK